MIWHQEKKVCFFEDKLKNIAFPDWAQAQYALVQYRHSLEKHFNIDLTITSICLNPFNKRFLTFYP